MAKHNVVTICRRQMLTTFCYFGDDAVALVNCVTGQTMPQVYSEEKNLFLSSTLGSFVLTTVGHAFFAKLNQFETFQLHCGVTLSISHWA